MRTLILAAGYATRLYPLTKHWPKPLLVVKEKPIINHILERIDGIKNNDEIIVITNEKFFHQFDDWAKNTKTKSKLTVISDKTSSADDRLGASRAHAGEDQRAADGTDGKDAPGRGGHRGGERQGGGAGGHGEDGAPGVDTGFPGRRHVRRRASRLRGGRPGGAQGRPGGGFG